MKPTNYAYWEARYGIRVIVHDHQQGDVRTTRVGTYPVSEAQRAAAVPFWAALDAYHKSPHDREVKRRLAITSRDYSIQSRQHKPPVSGATAIADVTELPDGAWSWVMVDDPDQGGVERTIEGALEAAVRQAHGEGQ